MIHNSLKVFLNSKKKEIADKLLFKIRGLDQDPFWDWVLNTPDGQHRLTRWIDVLIGSLGTGQRQFIEDQVTAGYIRASQGFNFERVSEVYIILHGIVKEVVNEAIRKDPSCIGTYFEKSLILSEMFLKGYNAIATSYMKTREGIINNKIFQLQELHNFTMSIMTTLKISTIAELTLSSISSNFKITESHFLISPSPNIQGNIYSMPKDRVNKSTLNVMMQSIQENRVIISDEKEMFHNEKTINSFKNLVAIPIVAHDNSYGAFSIVCENKDCDAIKRDLVLLNQYISIAAISIENAVMFDEIERRRDELKLLTERMLLIQEKERKRLASDIHDSLIQVLTSVSYKMQYCRELAKSKSPLQIKELDALTRIINQTIDQSRDMMTYLRPDLIDDLGLIAALKRLFENIHKGNKIKIIQDIRPLVNISSDISICLFRVTQEALTNVCKHAQVDEVKVSLFTRNQNIILIISDSGKGFDPKSCFWRTRKSKGLGLLSMKERVETVNGKLFVNSSSKFGCKIEAHIPIIYKEEPHE